MTNLFIHLKENNKGMSLVEAVVAVAIMSAACIPLLVCFAFAPKMNAKAKVKQRATNAAVSVMETFKAYSLDDIKASIEAESGNAFNDDYNYVSDDSTAPTSGVYGEYTITGLRFSDGTETKQYDVHVDISEGKKEEIGATPLFNPHWDVMFLEDRNISANYDPYEAINSLIEDLHIGSESENVAVRAHREIDIDVLNDGTVAIEYKYCGEYRIGGGISQPFTYDSSNDIKLKQVLSVDTMYDEEDDPEHLSPRSSLRNIYLYFYPCYPNRYKLNSLTDTDISVVFDGDQFYLSNNYEPNTLHGIEETNLLLVKQRDNSRFSGTFAEQQLVIAETNYSADLYSTEELNKVLNVYDVINKRLDDLDGSDFTFIKDIKSKPGSDEATANKDNIVIKSFTDESSTELVYPSRIRVTVYPSGETAALVSIDGSLLR